MDRRKLIKVQYCVNANLRKASRAMTQLYVTALKSTGLKGTQFSLLAMIGGMERTTMTTLSERLVMDLTTLTRSINLLEKQGLVASMPGEDKRMRIVTLTPVGEEALESALPLWDEVHTKITAGLGKEDTDKLLALLAKVTALTQEN